MNPYASPGRRQASSNSQSAFSPNERLLDLLCMQWDAISARRSDGTPSHGVAKLLSRGRKIGPAEAGKIAKIAASARPGGTLICNKSVFWNPRTMLA